MMTNKEIYKIWAPYGERWVDWVRPVPFVAITSDMKTNEVLDFTLPNIYYLKELREDTALIIDDAGIDAIKESIPLAKLGYRPIPVYNGTIETYGAEATTNNNIISFGLVWGAAILKDIEISKEAPPAFLLDSTRMNRSRRSKAVFDNSWDIYHQDLPTAEYFLKNGINKILIKGKTFNRDLKKILYKHQCAGIKILHTDGYEEAEEVILQKPKKD